VSTRLFAGLSSVKWEVRCHCSEDMRSLVKHMFMPYLDLHVNFSLQYTSYDKIDMVFIRLHHTSDLFIIPHE
jgi:hypothetical protein